MIVDFLLCLMMPCASVALRTYHSECLALPSHAQQIAEYVVQQYRYYIFEDIGCFSGTGHVVLAFPLVWMLPLLVGVVSAVYARV